MAMKRYSLKKTAKKRCVSNRGWIGGRIPSDSNLKKEMRRQLEEEEEIRRQLEEEMRRQLEEEEEMRRAEIRRQIFLTDPLIYGITLVMFPAQKEEFFRHIGNRAIPSDNDARSQFFRDYFIQAVRQLNENQLANFKTLYDDVMPRHRSSTPEQIMHAFDMAFDTSGSASRSASGGKKYHKRFTRKK